MNIFILDLDVKKCAQYHVDKHVVKMILETAQLLCGVHHVTGHDTGHVPYKLSHKNHPCAIWARESLTNYLYLCELGLELCNEYTYRYGKTHLTDTKLRVLLNEIPNNITLGSYSEPPQCMPEDVKVQNDSISAYHKYYANYKKGFAVWTDRPVPQFMVA